MALVCVPVSCAKLAGQALKQRADLPGLWVPLAKCIADERECAQIRAIECWRAAAQGVDRWASAADLNHNPQLR